MAESGPWTCPCGHELTPARECVVWDDRGREHLVPQMGTACSCHGITVRELEAHRNGGR